MFIPVFTMLCVWLAAVLIKKYWLQDLGNFAAFALALVLALVGAVFLSAIYVESGISFNAIARGGFITLVVGWYAAFQSLRGGSNESKPMKSETNSELQSANKMVSDLPGLQQVEAQISNSSQSITDTAAEDQIYSLIADELDGGSLDSGLWTRLYAECDGDEKRTKVLYIRQRARRLITQKVSSFSLVPGVTKANLEPERRDRSTLALKDERAAYSVEKQESSA